MRFVLRAVSNPLAIAYENSAELFFQVIFSVTIKTLNISQLQSLENNLNQQIYKWAWDVECQWLNMVYSYLTYFVR